MSPTSTGFSSDVLRQRNLSAVLRLVTRRGPVSRADLARETGLNRSTIGALVAELTSFGFVGETYPTVSQGLGRPSAMVAVDDRVVAVAVHVRHDHVTVATVGLGGHVRQSITLPHSKPPAAREAVETVAAVVAGLRQGVDGGGRVVGVGVGIPGSVRQHDGRVEASASLGWSDEPFAVPLAEATGLPVLAAGSSQLAVLAEREHGDHGEEDDVLFLTSDGRETSGGIIAGGRPLRGEHGFAADLGHLPVVPDGEACDCGNRGCLAAELRPLLVQSGLPHEGDAERCLHLTAAAVVIAMRVLDPALVVLGADLGTLHTRAPRIVESAVAAARRDGEALRVVSASHDLPHVIVGAAELAFHELLDDPGATAVRLDRLAEDSKHWSHQRLNPELFHRP